MAIGTSYAGKTKVKFTCSQLIKHYAMCEWMHSSAFWPRHWIEVSVQLHVPAALPPGRESLSTHWIGGWVDPRADLERREWLTLPGLELRLLDGPTHSQSLYRLRYQGSSYAGFIYYNTLSYSYVKIYFSCTFFFWGGGGGNFPLERKYMSKIDHISPLLPHGEPLMNGSRHKPSNFKPFTYYSYCYYEVDCKFARNKKNFSTVD
jgi:hypothetical protein